MYLWSYNNGSGGAKELRDNMDIKMIRKEGSKFRGSPDKIVVNWGDSVLDNVEVMKCRILNSPDAVKRATNKRSFFESVSNRISVPPFSVVFAEAKAWIDEGKTVVVRETLTGHSGEGIVLLDTLASFESYDHSRAKLYVMYIPKKNEYRVHVVGGKVVDVQRKAKSPEANVTDFRIRNHRFGFIFVRGDAHNCPEDVLNESVKAVAAVGLDFGAVDVIYNDYREKSYILEINTAPGLEGQTIETYSQGLSELLKELHTPKSDKYTTLSTKPVY